MECSSIFCGITGAKIRQAIGSSDHFGIVLLSPEKIFCNEEEDAKSVREWRRVSEVTGHVLFEKIVGVALIRNQYEVRV
jgi:hypothetical protein